MCRGTLSLAVIVAVGCGRIGFGPAGDGGPDGVASGQIMFVAIGAYTAQNTQSQTIAVTAPTGMQPGDVMIAQVSWSNATSIDTIAAPGWTQFRLDQTGAYYSQALSWRAYQAGDDGSTFQFVVSPNASTKASGVIAAYRNANTTTPIDMAATACNAGAIVLAQGATAPVITTTKHDEMVLFIAADASGQIASFPYTGYVDLFDLDSANGTGAWVAEQIVETRQSTSSIDQMVVNAADWVALQYALKSNGPIVRKGAGAPTHAAAGASSSSATLHCPPNVSSGDVLVALIAANYNQNAQLTFTSSSWQQINAPFFVYDSGSFLSVIQAVYVNTSGACAADPVFAGSGNYYVNALDAIILDYTGIDTSAPLDAESTGTVSGGTSATCKAPGVTTSYAGDLLLYMAQIRPYDYAPGLISNYTQRWFGTAAAQSILGADRLMATPTTTEATDAFQGNGGDVYFACHASLQQ
jgi:hypothetical protein